jgi:pimeloyl-ACP methyl ester carboxylesterase
MSASRRRAPDLRHTSVACGHFMAEEAPADIAKALRDLLAR